MQLILYFAAIAAECMGYVLWRDLVARAVLALFHYNSRLNLEWKRLCTRRTWQMEKNHPNTRSLLKAELSMHVSYWNVHVIVWCKKLNVFFPLQLEDEIQQYQASKFKLSPVWGDACLWLSHHVGCNSYLENNAQLKVVIEEQAQSSVMFYTVWGAWN